MRFLVWPCHECVHFAFSEICSLGDDEAGFLDPVDHVAALAELECGVGLRLVVRSALCRLGERGPDKLGLAQMLGNEVAAGLIADVDLLALGVFIDAHDGFSHSLV